MRWGTCWGARMDRIGPATRSRLMSRIRSVDTSSERALRRELRARGFGYRKNVRGLLGRPDIAFPGERIAVFVDGCFWHGCPRCYRELASNTAFWRRKVSANRERDGRQNHELAAMGWTVLKYWEHESLVFVADEIEDVVITRRRRAQHG